MKASLEIKIWTDEGPLPDDLPEALEVHVEHVASMCGQGYLAGEIVDDRFRGWWSITQGESETAAPDGPPKAKQRRAK